MRAERALSWIVLYAGIATMIATSDTDDDDDYGVRSYAFATAQVHSEGIDDAKIARLTITRSGSLRALSGDLTLTARASVSRPAADLLFALLHAAGGQDAGSDHDAGGSQALDGGLIDAGSDGRFAPHVAVHGAHQPMSGFKELTFQGSMNVLACAEEEVCSTVREIYIRAQAPEPFSLDLTTYATFESYSSHAGLDAGAAEETELSLSIEVVDAP